MNICDSMHGRDTVCTCCVLEYSAHRDTCTLTHLEDVTWIDATVAMAAAIVINVVLASVVPGGGRESSESVREW